jgi:hypothetical protein
MSAASLSTRDDISAQLRRIFRKPPRVKPPVTEQDEANPFPEAGAVAHRADSIVANPAGVENCLMTPLPVFSQESQLALKSNESSTANPSSLQQRATSEIYESKQCPAG